LDSRDSDGARVTAVLNLPAPEAIDLRDRDLVEKYSDFCATLRTIGDTAVLCDVQFFSMVVQTEKGGRVDLAGLKLLAALVGPGSAQMANIRQWVIPSYDDFDWAHGKYTKHSVIYHGSAGLRGLRVLPRGPRTAVRAQP